MLQLPNLARLDEQMVEASSLRSQFDWRNGFGHMRVSYLKDASDTFGTYPGTDIAPFAVLVFVNAQGSGYFTKLVNRKFEINVYMGDDYGTLKAILGLDAHGVGNPLNPNDLFTHFNQEIPEYRQTRSPNPSDLRPPRKVEEADKIYFLAIRTPNRGQTSPENLRKTRVMLGDKIAEYCERTGQSSFWTATRNDLTIDDINDLLGH